MAYHDNLQAHQEDPRKGVLVPPPSVSFPRQSSAYTLKLGSHFPMLDASSPRQYCPVCASSLRVTEGLFGIDSIGSASQFCRSHLLFKSLVWTPGSRTVVAVFMDTGPYSESLPRDTPRPRSNVAVRTVGVSSVLP